MSNLIVGKREMRTALLFCYRLKKTTAYGDNALSEKTCKDWFRLFKTGDFDVGDKERLGQPKMFQNTELQALLDENNAQTQ